MSLGPFPQPGVGQGAQVWVNSVPLRLVDGTWKVEEAPRFGDKISTGAVKYADFNVFESAQAVDSFMAGYGVRRYSDLPAPIDQDLSEMHVYNYAEDVDGSFGPAILSPLRVEETLPSSAATPVWIGEFTPSTGVMVGSRKLVCISGTKVWYRNIGGTWTDTTLVLAQTARQGAIGVFNGSLIIGYGAAGTAQYTTDLAALNNVTNTTPTAIYVFALTVDRAACYVTGGTAATAVNKVLSSPTSAVTFVVDASAVTCGSSQDPITALAPGGGIYQVMVGTQSGLGMIDSVPNYHVLVPFDSHLSTNCVGMRWALGSDTEAQRGPLSIFFPRDHSLWLYEPDTQSGGSAANVSAWSRQGFRPILRGITTAIQGTARWLYTAVYNSETAVTTILKRDQLTGAIHSTMNFGSSTCYAMVVTSLFGTNPLLVMGYGNNVVTVTLPLDGELPLDDDNCMYQPTGTLVMPDIDLGFPDEQKLGFFLIVVADGLDSGPTIEAFFNTDGGSYTSLGTMATGPSNIFTFPTGTSAKRIGLKFVLTTGDASITPQLLGFSLRVSLNPKLYRIWTFQAALPGGNLVSGSELLQNPKTIIDNFWAARRAGTPVSFKDRWLDSYVVRILHLQEAETARLPGATLETVMEFQLLEFSAGPGNILFDDTLAIFNDPGVTFGSP